MYELTSVFHTLGSGCFGGFLRYLLICWGVRNFADVSADLLRGKNFAEYGLRKIGADFSRYGWENQHCYTSGLDNLRT